VTERNRRGRGVLAGLLGAESSQSDRDQEPATDGNEQIPPAENGSTPSPENGGQADPGRGGAFSRPDTPVREAYEPGWYRVLASEPAEQSVRGDPTPANLAPADPTPSEPGPTDGKPSDPASADPTESEDSLQLSTPSEPIDSLPAFLEPLPVHNEPAFLEPLPVHNEPAFLEPLPVHNELETSQLTESPESPSGSTGPVEDPAPEEFAGRIEFFERHEFAAPSDPDPEPFEAPPPAPEDLPVPAPPDPEPADRETQPVREAASDAGDVEPFLFEPVNATSLDPAPTHAEPAPPTGVADPSDELQAPIVDASSGFLSLDAADRREALTEVASRGLRDEDIERVALLISDPEGDIRVFAVRTLQTRADAVPASVVRRALGDPTDEVRAEAVTLEAARSDPALIELAPIVAARRWPLTQQAAFTALPTLLQRQEDPRAAVDAILLAVARMESSPIDDERAGILALVRVIGRDRLIEALGTPDDRRLGATRMLLVDGSEEAMSAVARLSDDPLDEVRVAAQSARDQLAVDEPEPMDEPASVELEPVQWAPETVSDTLPEPEPTHAPAAEEILGVLAKALEDPDEGVRDRAGRELGEIDRGSLLEWTQTGLASRDHKDVAVAARVAEAAGLTEVAAEILGCAARLGPEERGLLVGALSSFGLDPADLVAVVGDVDANSRPDAIRLLWQVSGRGVLPALRGLLEDTSGPVRVAVLDVFGDSGDPSAIEVAHSVLETDSSPVVRATAIRVIGRAGLDQRTTSLSEALDDPDPDVRATAVELLPHGLAGQAGELLLKALFDDDVRVWQPAMRHLVSLPERDLPVLWHAIKEAPLERRDALISLLERTSRERLGLVAQDHLSSSDEDDRMLAISMAARSGSAEAMQGIIGTLADPQPAVRRAGAAALAEARDHGAIPALTRALNDPDTEVREGALKALSAIDDEQVLEPLINALKDPEERVRQLASDALIRWNSPAVARRLVEALTSPALRRPVIELLGRMGPAAVDPLVNLLREGHPELAGTVGITLEQLVGRDLFLQRLGSMDPAERLGAVEALGAMGGPESVDGLIRALSDPNESIRIRALGALGDMGDHGAIEAVRRSAQSDPMPEVAAAAEDALRKLQP
jgi:HEAT repeat protein